MVVFSYSPATDSRIIMATSTSSIKSAAHYGLGYVRLELTLDPPLGPLIHHADHNISLYGRCC